MQVVHIRTERENIITTDLTDITRTTKGGLVGRNKGILQTTLSQKFHNLDEMDQLLENYQVSKVTPNQTFGDSLVYAFSYKSLISSPLPPQTILIERIGILFKNLGQLTLLQKNVKECLIRLDSLPRIPSPHCPPTTLSQ